MQGDDNGYARQLEEIGQKALEDRGFAEGLLNPQQRGQALRDAGFSLSDDQIHELGHAMGHLQKLWEAFGGDYKAAS